MQNNYTPSATKQWKGPDTQPSENDWVFRNHRLTCGKISIIGCKENKKTMRLCNYQCRCWKWLNTVQIFVFSCIIFFSCQVTLFYTWNILIFFFPCIIFFSHPKYFPLRLNLLFLLSNHFPPVNVIFLFSNVHPAIFSTPPSRLWASLNWKTKHSLKKRKPKPLPFLNSQRINSRRQNYTKNMRKHKI